MNPIKKAAFVNSFAAYKPGMTPPLPEIAVVGRSNVGKSSLINMIAHNGKLARTSSEPGKTRLINYFRLDDAFYLVDLPGYGFARAPKDEQKRWRDMIEGYLTGSEQLASALLLVDMRHVPTEDDKMMADWFRAFGVPFTVVATKADKLSRAQRQKSLMDIGFALKLNFIADIVVTSAEAREGEARLVETMRAAVASAAQPAAETAP